MISYTYYHFVEDLIIVCETKMETSKKFHIFFACFI